MLLAAVRYVPFVTPAPLWGVWPLLAIPLVLAIAVVYKTTKVRDLRRLPLEALVLTLTILLVMAAGAAGLTLLVRVVLG